jgi:hypothetical protein
MSYEDIGDVVEEMIDCDASAEEILTMLEVALPDDKDAIGYLIRVLPREAGMKVVGAVLDRMVVNGELIRWSDGQYSLPHAFN